MSAGRQQRGGPRSGQPLDRRQRQGRVAARQAQRHRPARDDPHDRIIHPAHDRPVVVEECVRDAVELFACVPFVRGDRLFAAVAAGGDHREVEPGEQEVMQRRRGQEDAEARQPGRDLGRDLTAVLVGRSALEQHDRVLGAREQATLHRADHAQPCGVLDRRHHDRQRLGRPSLPLRRRATGPDRSARTRSWNPPSPLRATTSPSRIDSIAAARASAPRACSRPSRSRKTARGPQRPHATGWAWNRRSSGERYSARHAAHMANRRMLVRGRSYGKPSMIE